jgi:hypothetical protein
MSCDCFTASTHSFDKRSITMVRDDAEFLRLLFAEICLRLLKLLEPNDLREIKGEELERALLPLPTENPETGAW